MSPAEHVFRFRVPAMPYHRFELARCQRARAGRVGNQPEEDTEMMRMHTLGAGDPLVLVGGGLTGWLSWVPHQERLASSRQVARAQPLIVQLGLDGQPRPEDYSVEQESAALAAALESFHPHEPLDLVAWSYGGLGTLDYALDHPERIRSLTLIEPPAFWVLEANGDPAYEREREACRPLAERLRDDVTEADLVEFVRFASLCPPDVNPESLPQWPLWLEHRQSLRGQFDAEFAQRDTIERLRKFERPMLLVKGGGSTPVLHRIIDTLDATLPRTRLLELAGGHAPHIVEMERFLEELDRFHAEAGTDSWLPRQ
jgi:pimeloyl-ACP methyl ester carboxylesterase